MQVGFFYKIKHPVLSCSNMGNILLVKNFFPFSIDFRTSSSISAWSSLSQKECRESLGRRKAAVLYCQSCVLPELRQDVPGTELYSLVPVSASSLSRWLCCGAVLGMLGGRRSRFGSCGKWSSYCSWKFEFTRMWLFSWNVSGESEEGVRR